MAIKLISNVKVITSGKAPTIANLAPGEMAFGKLSKDGYYHLFGNADGSVVDVVLSTLQSTGGGGGSGTIPSLEQVLQQGNTTSIAIEFNDNNDNLVKVDSNEIIVLDKNNNLTKIDSTGFSRNGFPVLVADPNMQYSDNQLESFRKLLNVYTKDDIDGKLDNISNSLIWKDL